MRLSPPLSRGRRRVGQGVVTARGFVLAKGRVGFLLGHQHRVCVRRWHVCPMVARPPHVTPRRWADCRAIHVEYGAGPTSSVRGESRILSSSLGRRSPPVLTGVWGNSGEDDISQSQLLMGNRSAAPRCALGVPARPAGFQFSRMASPWLPLSFSGFPLGHSGPPGVSQRSAKTWVLRYAASRCHLALRALLRSTRGVG